MSRGFLKQYQDAKKEYPDSLLLFRMGDFYEAFDADAEIVAEVLNLAVTKRNGLLMTGFPQIHLDSYLKKLVAAGYRVAVAEFVPKESK